MKLGLPSVAVAAACPDQAAAFALVGPGAPPTGIRDIEFVIPRGAGI